MRIIRNFIFITSIFMAGSAFGAIKVCEINDPVTGNTPGCTEGSAIWGGGPDLVYAVKLYGETVAHVVKRENGWSSSCSISIDDNTYSISGNCDNYRIYADFEDHLFPVKRHTSTNSSWTNADVDQIMQDANSLLLSRDGVGDVKCPMRMIRNGSLTTYSTGDGTIDSEAEIMALPQGIIHIVDDINWCGSSGSYAGCVWNGRIMVWDVPSSTYNGPLWAHEIGHFQGIGGDEHRTEDGWVMTTPLYAHNKKVSWGECLHFREGN